MLFPFDTLHHPRPDFPRREVDKLVAFFVLRFTVGLSPLRTHTTAYSSYPLILLHGDADVTEKYYHVVVTRVRKRINRLEEEIGVLEAHDTLADELREMVCED